MKRRDFLKSSLAVAAMASFGSASEVFAASSPDLAKVHALIDKNFDEQIAATQKILRVESVLDRSALATKYPFGTASAKCLDTYLDIAREKGFTGKNVDNMIGYVDAGSGEKLLGILGHMDVVPAGDLKAWVTPPYEANIIDGKLYARGIMDDKGPMMANLYALHALKQSGIKLKKRVRVIAGIDEETGFRCVERYLKTEEVPYFSFSPDAQFAVVNSEKGLLQFTETRSFTPLKPQAVNLVEINAGSTINVVPDLAKAYFTGKTEKIKAAFDKLASPDISTKYVDNRLEVTVRGVTAHAKSPGSGKNALLILCAELAKLEFAPSDMMKWVRDFSNMFKNEPDGKSAGIACADEVSGNLTINPAILIYQNNALTLKVDMRYPISLSRADAEKKVQLVTKGLDTKCEIIKHKSPLYVPADTIEIKTLLTSYEAVTNEKAEVLSTGGGTYCRAFPNSVSFGPTFPDEADVIHKPNEFAQLSSLRKMTHIYAEAIYRLCNLA